MSDKPEQVFTSMAIIHRSDYDRKADYIRDYRALAQHYGYKARIHGGWVFFEFQSEYMTWRNQK